MARRTQQQTEQQPDAAPAREYRPAVGARTVAGPNARASLARRVGRFRPGQWVMVKFVLDDSDPKEYVGIHVVPKGDLSGEVHLVRQDGTTLLVLPEHPVANLREAEYEDIPASRRPKEDDPLYPSRARRQQMQREQREREQASRG